MEKKFDALAAGFNLVGRRHGDMVELASHQTGEKKPWAHGNTYFMPGTLKSAFQQLGKGVHTLKGEVGIDSTRRGLDDATAIGALGKRLFDEEAQKLRDRIQALKPPGAAVQRNFDTTPIYAKIGGKLEGILWKSARFLKRVDPPADQPDRYARWKTVSYAEHRRDHPHSSPQMGIFELFGFTQIFSWSSTQGSLDNLTSPIQPPTSALQVDSQEFTFPPSNP